MYYQYLVVPFSNEDMNNKIFDGPYNILKELLKSKNIELNTVDLGNIKTADKSAFGQIVNCIIEGN